jgi:hypothetical protein
MFIFRGVFIGNYSSDVIDEIKRNGKEKTGDNMKGKEEIGKIRGKEEKFKVLSNKN